VSESDCFGHLDRLVVSALGDHPSFEREVDRGRYIYRLETSDGRSVEIGHDIPHCWLYLDSWEQHDLGDGEDLEYDLELQVRVAELYLNGLISPPDGSDHREVVRRRIWRNKDRQYWILEDIPFGSTFVLSEQSSGALQDERG
jgi:hypothetical protein